MQCQSHSTTVQVQLDLQDNHNQVGVECGSKQNAFTLICSTHFTLDTETGCADGTHA
jgi:hypothetical protein